MSGKHLGNKVVQMGFMRYSPTKSTVIVIQLCLRSRIGLWEKFYYALFGITHYFSSYVVFTNIVARSGDSLVQRQSTECQLCEDNGVHNTNRIESYSLLQ